MVYGFWIAINGSIHMTLKKENFLDMYTSFNSQVNMRNDEVVEVKGKDNIGIETKKRRK
jgi:hypothetical protein